MKLLAVDTSTDACSVALAVGGEVRARQTREPRAHARVVLAMVDELLGEAGLTVTALDGVAVGCGPGSFTGVRIGCGVVQGLAGAADLPVVPLSSLATVAAAFTGAVAPGAVASGTAAPDPAASVDDGSGLIVVAQDARMREVYWAAWRVVGAAAGAAAAAGDVLAIEGGGALRPVVAERADLPTAVASRLRAVDAAARVAVAAGAGLGRYPDLAQALAAATAHADALPCAAHALRLAAPRLRAGAGVPAEQAVPVYLRPPV